MSYQRNEQLTRLLASECDRLLAEDAARKARRSGTRAPQPEAEKPFDAAAHERDSVAAELVRRLALRDQGR